MEIAASATKLRFARHVRAKWILSGILLAALAACAQLEKFSGTSTNFNVQVAESQDRIALLNIVRAAYRYPMHFTELTTLSGTGTVTVGGTLTVPVGTLNGGAATGSIAPTASVSDTPTFNMAVLETQEFYQGMLKPVPLDESASYIMEGLPLELVLTLQFQEILYQRSEKSQRTVIENNFHRLKSDAARECPDATTPNEYSCFRLILRALIDRGLTVEQVSTPTNIGPLIPASSFSELRWLAGLDLKSMQVVTVNKARCDSKDDACPDGLAGLPSDQRAQLTAGESLYRIQQLSKDYQLCFDPPSAAPADVKPANTSFPKPLTDRIMAARLPEKVLCHWRVNNKRVSGSARSLELTDPDKPDEVLRIDFEPRSTEGIIYFLGEISRCSLKLESTSVCSAPTVRVKYQGIEVTEDLLFAMSPEAPRPQSGAQSRSLSVDWGGHRYFVNMDPGALDRSGQVLRILTQLVALNSSAKDLPVPAVVPLITH